LKIQGLMQSLGSSKESPIRILMTRSESTSVSREMRDTWWASDIGTDNSGLASSSGQIQYDRILFPEHTGGLGIKDVNGRLARPQAIDNTSVEILIREEANGHLRFGERCRRAASKRAKSSGFVWLSRGADSNSRSPSAK